ncbi:MAG: helix-turn-helix transcriptional regulator [Gemmatimonadota bacterium]|jgi:DNA-binding PadR family transcriptional regulator
MPDEPTSPLPPAEFRILLALLDGAKHGHGIKLDVRDRTEGRVEMGPGSLYGAIKRLAGRGWIEEVASPEPVGERDERRRYYAVTPEGRDAATAELRRMDELMEIAREKGISAGRAGA